MRRYKVVYKSKDKNITRHWWKIRNPLIVLFNITLILIAGIIPFFCIKKLLYRLIGIKIGKNVSFAPLTRFGFFFPKLIKLEDNCTIGFDALILEHEWTRHEARVGEVVIGKNALIGARSIILPGVKVGENAVVGAGSVVTKDVPKNAFVCGVPAKIKRKK